MRILVALVIFVTASPALAQTVKNPRTVSFTCDGAANPTTLSCEDAKQITAYEVDIVRPDNSVLRTLTIPAVAPGANGVITLTMNVQPIEFGSYTVVVRGVAGSLKTTDSPKSDAWERMAGPPSKPSAQ